MGFIFGCACAIFFIILYRSELERLASRVKKWIEAPRYDDEK